MEIQPAFPPHRRQDPRRRAEAIVYDQLARSGLPGHALYELKALPEAPELDFFAVLLIAGNIIWVVYEVIRATGSPVDTLHSIITNLWQASAAALFFTLTVAGYPRV